VQEEDRLAALTRRAKRKGREGEGQEEEKDPFSGTIYLPPTGGPLPPPPTYYLPTLHTPQAGLPHTCLRNTAPCPPCPCHMALTSPLPGFPLYLLQFYSFSSTRRYGAAKPVSVASAAWRTNSFIPRRATNLANAQVALRCTLRCTLTTRRLRRCAAGSLAARAPLPLTGALRRASRCTRAFAAGLARPVGCWRATHRSLTAQNCCMSVQFSVTIARPFFNRRCCASLLRTRAHLSGALPGSSV